MRETEITLAGLETRIVEPDERTDASIVLLHGYAMDSSDLAPFARSLNLPARFFFPRGPHEMTPKGRAWWPIDVDARERALSRGARDLASECPAGLPAARARIESLVADIRERFSPARLIVGGFSQGGMLSCDHVLHSASTIDGLVLLSASRLNFAEWRKRSERLRDLPVFVSHGERDDDLSFAAGERLRDFLVESGSRTHWARFDGGHEIPLPVWRSLRKFLVTSLRR